MSGNRDVLVFMAREDAQHELNSLRNVAAEPMAGWQRALHGRMTVAFTRALAISKPDDLSRAVKWLKEETSLQGEYLRRQWEIVDRALAQPLPVIDVVAAVRRRADGGVWLCKRNHTGKHAGLAGMWEYPGGKVETDEQLRDAMRRELVEEFGDVSPNIGAVLDSIDATYEGTTYRVTFFSVEMSDPVALNAHEETRWMTPVEACTVEHLTSGTIFNARHLAPQVTAAWQLMAKMLGLNPDTVSQRSVIEAVKELAQCDSCGAERVRGSCSGHCDNDE